MNPVPDDTPHDRLDPERRLAAGAAVVLTVLVAVRRDAPHVSALEDPEQWYEETLALDAPLRPALVLADTEARDVITQFPNGEAGGVP